MSREMLTHVCVAAAAILHLAIHTVCLSQTSQQCVSTTLATRHRAVHGRCTGDAGGTASHSSDTAAPLLGPASSSSSSGSPAPPADALAHAAPEQSRGPEAACSEGSAAPEVSVLDDGTAAAGQEGSSSGSGDHAGEDGAAAASQEFPVAGFSRKDTPYVCQVPLQHTALSFLT